MRKPLATVLTLSLVLGLGGALRSSTHSPGVRLAPAKTWVGLARVHLEVSELKVVQDALVGSYAIRVPLAPDRDDHGTVRFDLTRPLEQVLVEGSVLQGVGRSSIDQRIHRIRCAFGQSESVRIEVDSGDRRLSFRSRWLPR